MAATIISSLEMSAARETREIRIRNDKEDDSAERLPPVSTTLVDTLFRAETDHRIDRAKDRKAA